MVAATKGRRVLFWGRPEAAELGEGEEGVEGRQRTSHCATSAVNMGMTPSRAVSIELHIVCGKAPR